MKIFYFGDRPGKFNLCVTPNLGPNKELRLSLYKGHPIENDSKLLSKIMISTNNYDGNDFGAPMVVAKQKIDNFWKEMPVT